MKSLVIVTNNPLVKENFPKKYPNTDVEIDFREISFMDILKGVRDMVPSSRMKLRMSQSFWIRPRKRALI